MSFLNKLTKRLNIMLIPVIFYAVSGKLILQCICKCKGVRIAQTILKKNNKVGGYPLTDCKNLYRATVIKTVCQWHKNKHKNE